VAWFKLQFEGGDMENRNEPTLGQQWFAAIKERGDRTKKSDGVDSSRVVVTQHISVLRDNIREAMDSRNPQTVRVPGFEDVYSYDEMSRIQSVHSEKIPLNPDDFEGVQREMILWCQKEGLVCYYLYISSDAMGVVPPCVGVRCFPAES